MFHNPAAQRRSLVRPLLAGLLLAVLAAALYQLVEKTAPTDESRHQASGHQACGIAGCAGMAGDITALSQQVTGLRRAIQGMGRGLPKNARRRRVPAGAGTGLRCMTERG